MNTRPNPYVGPRAFETGEVMYGRDVETRRLFEMLVSERILLLHAPSGAGKSSLVRAGLVPLLRAEGFHVLNVARVNTDTGFEPQADADFNRYTHSALLSFETGLPPDLRTPSDQLAAFSLKGYLDQRPRLPDEPDLEVLLIDQFEEILTTAPNDRDGKLAFFQQLGEALRDNRRWALISMREDYLGALDPYLRPVPTRLSHTFRLDFLSVSAAIEAVRRPPQETAGVVFSPAAAQALVDDLRTTQMQQPDGSTTPEKGPIIEPVQLQVVCFRLWENLAADDMEISEDDLASVGDVDESLAQYFQSSLEAVCQKLKSSERGVREWFEYKLISESRRSTVRKDLSKSGDLDNTVIEALRDVHLVRAEQRAGATWYELAHDRLIGPVLKNNAAWFQEHLSLLQRQATSWERRGRLDNLLLSSVELGEASQWAEAHPDKLIQRDRDLLNASLEAEQAAQLNQRIEAERQRAEEKARAAARLRKLLILALAAMAVAVVFGIVAVNQASRAMKQTKLAEENSRLAQNNAATATSALGVANIRGTQVNLEKQKAEEQQQIAETASAQAVAERQAAIEAQNLAEAQKAAAEAARALAVQNEQKANEQAGLANSRQLAAQAQSNELTNLSLAYLLAVEAYNTSDTFEARNILLERLQQSQGSTIQSYGAPIPNRGTFVFEISLSPTDPYLAWGDREGHVVVWDYKKGEAKWDKSGKINAGFGHSDNVWAVAFSPDGKMLATGGQDQKIILWNVEAGEGTMLNVEPRDVFRVKFNSDGSRLAAAVQNTVNIYNTSAGKLEPVPLPRPIRQTEDINAVAWSPDGRLLITGSDDGTIKIYNAATAAEIRSFQTGGKVLDVEWQPGTSRLAAANSNHDVIIYDATLGREILRLVHDATPDNGNNTAVYSVAFSHDGKLMASAGNDNRIILWDPSRGVALEDLPLGDGQLRGIDFSDFSQPNLLASGGTDGIVRLFEITAKQPLKKLEDDFIGSVIGMQFSGDQLLSTTDPASDRYKAQDRQLQFRQADSLTWQTEPGSYSSLAFSAADGDRVALGDSSGMVSIFNSINGAEILAGFLAGDGRLTALAYDSDGGRLATGHCTQEDQAGLESSIGVIKFTGAGTNTPTVCAGSEIRFWDISQEASSPPQPSGQPILVPGKSVSALVFNPAGDTIAAGAGSTIQVYDVKTGNPQGLPLEGHIDLITSLAYRDDGTLLASASQDKTLRLWDTRNQQTIGSPFDTGEIVRSLAFDPTQAFLYSGDDKGVINRWLASPQGWKDLLCSLAGRNMTQEEAEIFLGKKPNGYQTCPINP